MAKIEPYKSRFPEADKYKTVYEKDKNGDTKPVRKKITDEPVENDKEKKEEAEIQEDRQFGDVRTEKDVEMFLSQLHGRKGVSITVYRGGLRDISAITAIADISNCQLIDNGRGFLRFKSPNAFGMIKYNEVQDLFNDSYNRAFNLDTSSFVIEMKTGISYGIYL